MFCCGVSKKSKRLQKHSDQSILPSTASTKSLRSSPSGSVGQVKSLPDNGFALAMTKLRETGTEKDIFNVRKVFLNIFSFLTVNELLKMRSVNKIWNRLACEVLREKLEGVIILQRGLGYYTRSMSSSNDIPIGKIFLNILDMDEPQPKNFFRTLGHTLYYLILNLEGHSAAQFQTNLHYLKNLKELSLNLFNEFGKGEEKSTQKLRERRKTGADVKIFIDDYDEIMNNNNNGPLDVTLPNLESIILSCEQSWKSNEPLLMQQLMKASPNLKNLNLHKWPFPLKFDLFASVALENLQYLTLAYISDDNLKALASKGLKLKSADFCFDYDVEGHTFDKFLESVSSTLQYIRIDSKSNSEIVFRLPTKMPSLKTIRLTQWVGPIWLDSVAGNGGNLSKLEFSNCNPGYITLKHPKINSNVTYLAVCFGHYSTVSLKTRSAVVNHFIHAFPKLECIMMKQVSDKTLGQIVNGWPNLKTLRVTSAFGLTDSGLTGIPIAELSKMTKLENKLSCGCCLPVPVVDAKPDVDSVRKYPHIGMLHDLVDLSIESEEGSHFPLTNFSLHLGVHELTKLQSLKITCHNELGPHWCLMCIADNLPNLKELTVMDRVISHDRYEEHEVLYLRRRLPNLKLNPIPTNIANHTSQVF